MAGALWLASCAGESSGAAQRSHCERLRDHLVELRLAGVEADVESHRATFKQALGDTFIDRCTAQLTTEQVQCALATRDSARAVKCTGTSVAQAK